MQEEQSVLYDPKKFHIIDLRKNPLRTLLFFFGFIVISCILAFFYLQLSFARPAQNTKEKLFEIKKGEGAFVVSDNLSSMNLVNSKMAFNLYVVMYNYQDKLQAGEYKIPAGYSIKQLVELFQNGRNDMRITIPEGLRVEEIALKLSKSYENVKYSSFVEKAKVYEGCLFPDTYDFPKDISEEEIIKAMQENCAEKTSSISGFSNLSSLQKNETLILASIVEREAVKPEDRRIIAGILKNRLKTGQLLGADATVQYAVGTEDTWWPTSLTVENLDFDSPYNTRKNLGLPPAPICNPGLDSIMAVMESTNTNFYYYLTDSEGITHYAKTLPEHNANVSKYLIP